MVTKQQQLEWLASSWPIWYHPMGKVFMSRTAIGNFVSMTNNSHQIIREEWQRERNKMSSKPEVDNSWHERGELPPVGCECLILNGETVKIISHGSISCLPVAFYPYGMDGLYSAAPASSFRPPRTEREKAIDEMAYEFIDHYGDPKGGERYLKIATKLYDAGYRKVKP